MNAGLGHPSQLKNLKPKKSSKDIGKNSNNTSKLTANSASKSLKVEKKAKSQLGKEQLLHSSQEPTAQAFTESHLDGSLEVNLLGDAMNNTNIFNSLTEKKKEIISNFQVTDGKHCDILPTSNSNKYTCIQAAPKPVIKPKKQMSNSQTFNAQLHQSAKQKSQLPNQQCE